jgi:rare lipoprotein A (peptidoglycan hydrolase)
MQIFAPKPVSVEVGVASWYGGKWIGRLTASGERYRADDFTAAHKKIPFNTYVRVVDLKSDKSIIVRINNRGPFVKGRIIDLSVEAAKKLGTFKNGLAKVRLEVLRPIPIMTSPNLKTKSSKPSASPTPTPTPLASSKPKSKFAKPSSLPTPSPTPIEPQKPWFFFGKPPVSPSPSPSPNDSGLTKPLSKKTDKSSPLSTTKNSPKPANTPSAKATPAGSQNAASED